MTDNRVVSCCFVPLLVHCACRSVPCRVVSFRASIRVISIRIRVVPFRFWTRRAIFRTLGGTYRSVHIFAPYLALLLFTVFCVVVSFGIYMLCSYLCFSVLEFTKRIYLVWIDLGGWVSQMFVSYRKFYNFLEFFLSSEKRIGSCEWKFTFSK